MKHKNILFAAGIALLTLSLSGAAAFAQDGDDAAEITDGGEFVYGSATELNNFDPFTSITADVRSVDFNIFEGLVKPTPEGDFAPAIAEDYSISEDGTEYSFTLREDVSFHNGETVTPEDVLYSIQKAIDSSIIGYDEIDHFEIADDGKLVITLKQSDQNFIPTLTQAIVPENAEDLEHSPIGTGPYKLTEYEEQDHITLEKNEDYWGTPAHLDKITIKFATDQAELYLLFEAGSIDGFGASAATLSQLDEDSVNLYVTTSNAVQLLALNNDFEPFQDQRVREAINYAVSADEIIDIAFYGYGTKVGSGLIPALSRYFNDELVDVYNQDLEKAKELLAEAGYEDGLSFTIAVPSVYQAHIDTAEVIVNELAAAGINAEIKQVDWATWLETIYQNREFEATIISLTGSVPYPSFFLSRYTSDSDSNFINYKSEAFDTAFANAVAEADQDKKVELFKEAQKVLSDESASVFIQDISSFLVYNKEFAGNVNYPLYATDFSAIYHVE